MPLLFKKLSVQTVEERMKQALNLLAEIDEKQKDVFLTLLNARIEDFKAALKKEELSDSEKEQIITQYNRFANTLFHCLKFPKSSSLYITNYHNQRYYPVGIDKVQEPSRVQRYGSSGTAITGASLILASMIVFAFNPIAGAVLLAIGVALLAPSLIIL